MNAATKRAILRWIHLVFTIPILGVIYQSPAETQQYIGGVRYIFVPALMLSGYWMYAGIIFAVIGAAVWLSAFYFFGFGPALLSQVVLFIVRNLWLVIHARRLA